MKSAVLFLLLLFTAACSTLSVESQRIDDSEINSDETAKKVPILVELYTSEGCSSCPPADRALAFLEKEQPYMQAEIITLALHVDYWNYLGWKDEFSSPMFSQRQEFYAQKFKIGSIYTPQMVVDGNWEFVGSDSRKASKAIFEAIKLPKANIMLANTGDKLKINITDVPEHENSTVFLAIAEDNLSRNIKRGENSGQTLEHTSVVRELKALGIVKPEDESFEMETEVLRQNNWNIENLKFVVFVQENSSRKILGINKTKLEKPQKFE